MGKLVLVLFAYFLGSVLFGKIIADLKGVDLRKTGSGNVGATNASRALGKKFGMLVFLLDAVKGFLPTALAVSLYGSESKVVAVVGVASVMGHMFSIFDGFKGGKGVATAFGVLVAISFKVALLSLTVWVVLLYLKRYVSLASIGASLTAPVFIVLAGFPFHIFLMSAVISALIIYKHKDNIRRILEGKERKV